MKVQRANETATPLNQFQFQKGTDAATKSLQKQIANAKKALQELSANKGLSTEQKMQKSQELKQQIMDLENQLRQHQIELRREQQQAQKAAKDEAAGRQGMGQKQPGYGILKDGMEAMVSAGTAMKQAKAYGSTAMRLKGEARVLQGEIKLDKDRGIDVGQKEGRLAKMEERIEAATSSQLGILEEAGQRLQESSRKGQEEKAEGKKDSEETKDIGRKGEMEKAEGIDGKDGTNGIGKEEEDREQGHSGRGKKLQDGQFVDIRL